MEFNIKNARRTRTATKNEDASMLLEWTALSGTRKEYQQWWEWKIVAAQPQRQELDG